MEEDAQDMETKISRAMRARIIDFKDQADSLTLEGVRRSLEKDMGLKTFTLDAHKRFIKQCLHECFSELDDENVSKSMEKNSEQVVNSEKEETTNPDIELQPHSEATEPGSEDEEKKEGSPVPTGSEMTEHEAEETEGDKSEKSLSEDMIKKAIKKRASYFRDNSETITLSGARRLLEEDLKLEKNALDAYKSFISKQLDEVLQSPKVVKSTNGFKKKAPKKASDSKVRGGSSKGSRKVSRGDGSSDSSHSNVSSSGEEDVEEQLVRPKKQAVKKVAARNTEGQKKRKRSTEERKPSSNEKNKPVKLAAEKGSDTDEGGNSSEDDKSQSSAEEPVKKKRETSTQVYGKRVEHLKSIIKACGMSIPPSVYKRVKQAPKNKREAHLVKELEEILGKEGLSSNPSEKEIKEVRKQKERARKLKGIDLSNIVSSSRRRSTSKFIIPPQKFKLAVEKNGGGGGGDEEEDTDDEESEREGVSEGIMSHSGASSTSWAAGWRKEQVEFNEVGQLVGEKAASFSTFLGQVTRTHCPIRYANWRDVPNAVKDNIWSMITGAYEIDEKYKKKILQKASKSLRSWKFELRKHYDRFDQDAERRRNCPKGVKQEDWDSFIDVESMEQSISRREKAKASRKEMKRPHTSGRRGAARTAEKMQKENPNTIITRTDLYAATHTRSDGSYPTPELSVTMERIKSIIASDPASTHRDLDHDPVAQVCGRDSRGFVRGMGDGISKTTIMASTPYLEEARNERSARLFLESRMEATMAEMLKRLDEEKAFRMSLEQQLADIRQQIAYQGQQVHCSPNTKASQAYHQSGDASSLQEDSVPTPRTEQICRFLTDFRGRGFSSEQLMRDNRGI